MNKTCGIYGIFNTINGKVLVGSSNDVEGRLKTHKCQCKKNKHFNEYLQVSWNKYGENAFEFRILECCSDQMLLEREDAWMEYYNSLNPIHGYNLQNATRTVVTEDMRKKLSLASLKRWSKRHVI